MDRDRFDEIARVLAGSATRRRVGTRVLGFGLASGLGLGLLGAAETDAKKTKPKPNEFGCLDAGQACGGSDAKCCSGICQGRKPKKGKKDTSRCVAHNTGGCQAGVDQCAGVEAGCGTDAVCYRTTGNASFCGAFATLGDPSGQCMTACTKDTDCQLTHGQGAACIVCPHITFCGPNYSTFCIAAGA